MSVTEASCNDIVTKRRRLGEVAATMAGGIRFGADAQEADAAYGIRPANLGSASSRNADLPGFSREFYRVLTVTE
jgi:hypothetical protein